MIKGLFGAVLAALAGFAVGLMLLAATAPAHAQAYQPNFNCESIHRSCLSQADKVNPGKDPCSAYSRCQSKKMCEQSRCICLRSGGSEDPALIEEATIMCNLLTSPHGPNSCDSYVKACQAWYDQQNAKPDPPQDQPPQTPAHPQPGMPDVPLPPDQQPRFR